MSNDAHDSAPPVGPVPPPPGYPAAPPPAYGAPAVPPASPAQPPAPAGVQPFPYGQPDPYGQPPHPAYGQPGPGYGPPAYAPKPSNGTVPWALGFIIFVPIPFLSALASGIAMAITYGAVSRHGGVARENARSALNWGLTFALVSTMLLFTHFILLAALTRDAPIRDFYPFGTVITLYAVSLLAHVVIVIVGTVRASQGKVTNIPVAIPFVRR